MYSKSANLTIISSFTQIFIFLLQIEYIYIYIIIVEVYILIIILKKGSFMKNIQKILNSCLTLSISLGMTIQLCAFELTPEREAEIMAKINAMPALTKEREAEILAKANAMTEEQKARVQAKIDTMTPQDISNLEQKIRAQSPKSFQPARTQPIALPAPVKSPFTDQQAAALQAQLEKMTPTERNDLQKRIETELAARAEQTAILRSELEKLTPTERDNLQKRLEAELARRQPTTRRPAQTTTKRPARRQPVRR
jgi:hypothetical protein